MLWPGGVAEGAGAYCRQHVQGFALMVMGDGSGVAWVCALLQINNFLQFVRLGETRTTSAILSMKCSNLKLN